jgi:ATP-dependent RNA helicase DDX19/DBP5
MQENNNEYDLQVARDLFFKIREDSNNLQDQNRLQNSLIISKGKMYKEAKDFESMNIGNELVNVLYSQSFDKPSLVQSRVIPTILNGGNVAVQSPSGTGKTIAYLLGVIKTIEVGYGPQALILSPTRELNTQIAQVLDKFVNVTGLRYHLAVRGTQSFHNENNITEEIVLGSPGSILTLCTKNKINPNNIRILVFDEADLLLDKERMGAQSFRILKGFPHSRKVFVSATYNEELKNTLHAYCNELTEMYESKNRKPDEIQLYYIESGYKQKIEAIMALIGSLIIGQCIIFVSTKKTVKELQEILEADFNTVAVLHGDLSPPERDEVVRNFKEGKSKILVTTDVFSRGMDIPMVNLIINFDLPYHDKILLLDTYIHRIGRSGRFGRVGFVVDLINSKEFPDYLQIQNSLDTISRKFTIEALEKVHLQESGMSKN